MEVDPKAVMPCPQCQHENPEGAKFCNACGARLVARCHTCGYENPPAAQFCNACGMLLSATTAPPGDPQLETRRAPEPAPLSYTPQYLAEKILTSQRVLEGERKQVTVLFADIKDSTELIKDLDPEDAQQLLDPAIHIMMEAVHRFEGTVNQVLGDGIMSIFGAPIAHEDHAARACYAALAMQAAMQDYTDAVRRHQGLELRIRVGLNSGEVVVRTIGNDLHMDYSAVGPTTHLASRMEQLAIPRHESPDTMRAETHYHQALTLSTELGMRPLQAHCHRGLGTLYRQTGHSEHARAELATAIDMYRDMAMTFWLPETEAALAEVGGKT